MNFCITGTVIEKLQVLQLVIFPGSVFPDFGKRFPRLIAFQIISKSVIRAIGTDSAFRNCLE